AAPSAKEPAAEERSGGGARETAEAPAAIAPAPTGSAADGATAAEGAAGAAAASRTAGTAPAAEARGPQPFATGGGSVPGRAYGFIQRVIQQGVSYPAVARRMGWEGRVIVAFRILQDGTVRDIRVVEGSGHAVLDRSAVEAVRSASPFPQPPAEAEIVTPVVYKLF
ncbi:MAG: energy transducer TonB, partial [Verrucomicrobiota bacterium]